MKRLSDQTLYEIIEISVDAPPEEIERACDRAAATYGPDSLATYTLAAPEETALLSSRIEEARAVLLDPGARARYDERIGVRPVSPPAGAEPEVGREAEPPQPAATPWPPPGPPPAPEQGAGVRPVSPGLPIPPVEATARPPVEPAAAAPPIPLSSPVAPIRLTAPLSAPPPATGAAGGPAAPIRLEKLVEPVAAPAEPAGSPWSGAMLRQVREARGLTVQQLAERTRVTRYHLENIEQDRFESLPAPVYLRGIIVSLARELRLDGPKVARSYLERMTPPGGEGPPRR